MEKITRVGIVGATGYVGMELVRLLAGHSQFRMTRLISQTYAGKKFSDIYPAFRQVVDLPLSKLDVDDLAGACDLVITALPHGISSEIVPQLLDHGLRVLDHSGDFRYRDLKNYEASYKLTHPAPELLSEAVYGLPEIYREKIKNARLVANPGCYPTCSLLALLPVLRESLIDTGTIIIDAVSGISGAGRKADLAFSFCEADASFKAYGIVGHRHTSEIEQEASFLAGVDQLLSIAFTPHLAPIKRGMLATVYGRILPGVDSEKLRNCFSSAYADEPFIRLLAAGEVPETRHVSYTNFCDLAFFIDEKNHLIKILSAIDNLGKGAAAQAIQSLNCMVGLPETSGLICAGGSI